MLSDDVSFSLVRNVQQLQHKLNRTEKSIDSLASLAQRYCFDDHSLMSGHHHDDTGSLPPPLTVEELMLESSFVSSTSSNFSKHRNTFQPPKKSGRRKKTYCVARNQDNSSECTSDYTQSTSKNYPLKQLNGSGSLSEYTLNSYGSRDSYPAGNGFDLFVPISEHTLDTVTTANNRSTPPCPRFAIPDSASECGLNLSNSFHLLHPDTSYPAVQLTSSPQRSSSQLMTEAKHCRSLRRNASIIERPRSSCSYRDFTNKLLPANDRKCAAVMEGQRSVDFSSSSLPCVSALPSNGKENEILPNQRVRRRGDDRESDEDVLDSSPQRPISARSNATSVTLTASDNKDADHLKQKLSFVRSENARLRTLVSQLRDQLEKYSDMIDLSSPSSQNEDQLTERILCLLDQIKANEKTLRHAEDKLEEKDKISAEKDQLINTLKYQLVNAEKVLEDCNSRKLLSDTAREEAVREAKVLSVRLKESYSVMTNRLEESQGVARKEVAKVASEYNNTLRRCETLKQENEALTGKMRDLQKKVRALENESRLQDVDSAKMMDQAQQRIRELVEELDKKHSSLKKSNVELSQARDEKTELLDELADLRQQNKLQRERLHGCQQENEFSRLEIEDLKKSVTQLKRDQTETNQMSFSPDEAKKSTLISPRKHHSTVSELNMQIATKEAHIKRLEARLSSQAAEAGKLENLAEEMLAVNEKARASERRVNELEDVVHLMESERTKYLRKVNDLQDQLHDKAAESDSLEKRLKERTMAMNESQRKGDDLTDRISCLEVEVKQKKEEISSLRLQISEQATNEEQLKSKLSNLNAELMEKSRSLEGAADMSSKQEASHRRETKKMKKIHAEQCEELMEQVDVLQQECSRSRNQLSMAKQQMLFMGEQLEGKGNHILQLEGEIALIKNEEKSRVQTHEETLKSLEEKLSSSSKTIQSLEDALSQCKNELSGFIEKHSHTHSNFNHQLAVKSDQVAKLETDLKLAQSSLHDECSRAAEFESALGSRQKMLEDAASRIAELEESQAALQSQVAKQEQKHSSEAAKANRLIFDMEEKLELACRELDSKKRQYTELNGALKKVDENFHQCKRELATVEGKVEDLRNENEVKSVEIERSKYEWKEMKADLDAKIERVAELEAETKKFSREEEKLREKVLEMETDLTDLRSLNQDTLHHNDELKVYSQHRNADILDKEMKIAQLQDALKSSKSECDASKVTSQELKKSLEERQWQLQQRAAQMTQLDAQVQDFRRNVEKRNHKLENELEATRKQLQERNSQVSHLDDQMTSMRSDVAEVRRLLAEEQLNVKRLERELIQKEDRVEELTQTVEAERKSREERHRACIETSQEVRLAREREQKMGRSYQDVQRELSRLQREHNQLLSDMNEMSDAARGKDERLDRLTSQLSALTSEKISIESKYREELDKTQEDAMRLKRQFEEESEDIISANSHLRHQLNIATGNQADELTRALEREKQALAEAKRAKETLETLERELVARKHVIESGNDTIVLKDAEIARLHAKLSGMERVSIMTSLPNTPVKLGPTANKENIPLPSSAASPRNAGPSVMPNHNELSSKPKWSMEDATQSSLFAGVDSEAGSLAPSFVPIAASTKRRPDPNEDSFFFTSSPNNTHHVSGLSAEEESLYRRVFGECQSDDCSSDSLSQVVIGRRPANQLAPDRCMVDLQEKLRASEERRKQVASKLRNLKSSVR